MKKLLIILSFLLCFGTLYVAGQPVVPRSNSTITVQDSRSWPKLNSLLPRYPDTTTANLTANIGEDSASAVISLYDNTVWLRVLNPKRWVQIATGTINSVNIYNHDGTILADRLLSGSELYSLTFDSLTSFTSNSIGATVLRTYDVTGISTALGASSGLLALEARDNNTAKRMFIELQSDSIKIASDQVFPTLASIGDYKLLARSPTGGLVDFTGAVDEFGRPGQDDVQSNGYRSFTQNDNIFAYPGGGVVRFGDSIPSATQARVSINNTGLTGNYLDIGSEKPYSAVAVTQGKVNFTISDTVKVNTNLRTAGFLTRRKITIDTSGNITFSDKYNVADNFVFFLRDTIHFSPLNADLLNAHLTDLEFRKNPTYTGRSVVSSGSTSLGFDAANALLGRIQIFGSSVGNNFRLRGFYSSVTGHMVGSNNTLDTVDNWTAFLGVSGGLLSPVITRGYNFLGTYSLRTDSVWGIYTSPSVGWNFLGAPLMIGASNTISARLFTQTPDNTLLLELNSTTKSMRGPAMTGTQMNAISSPANGSLVYNTDSLAYCWYNGSSWAKIGSGGAGSGGTVTSVAAGFGTAFTTITTTGSVIVDSFTMATRLRVQKLGDSINANVNTKWGILGNASTTAGTNYIGTSDNNAFDFRSNATQAMRLNTAQELLIGSTTDQGAFKLQVTGDSYFSSSITVPGAGTNSQQFGPSNTAAQTQSITVGSTNSNNGLRSIVIGYGNTENAGASFADNLIIHNQFNNSTGARDVNLLGLKYFSAGDDNVSINGKGGTPTGSRSVTINAAANVAINDDVLIGYNATASGTATGSIALGSGATVTGSNQFVAGSSSFPATDMYFGKGITNTSATTYTINGTGGSGSNNVGANLNLAAGKATGNAAGGLVTFQTSDVGSTGSTLQTLATRATIDGNGFLMATGKNIRLQGSSSGVITIQTQAASGTYNLNVPITAGNTGNLLTSGGGGSSPNTWTGAAVGAYLPTWTGITNISNITADTLYYQQIGNTVWIWGAVTVDPTAIGQTQARFTLPSGLTSNLIASRQLTGNAASTGNGAEAGQPAAIYGDSANEQGVIDFVSVGAAFDAVWYINCSYRIY